MLVFQLKHFLSRCGNALKDLFFSKHTLHNMCGIPIKELLQHKQIYQPGAGRKVGVKEMCMHSIVIMITDMALTS